MRGTLMAGLASAMLALSGVPAVAQGTAIDLESDWCAHAGETVWEAPRPAQNDLARVTLDLRCREGAVAAFRVKAETRCGRALCTWSWAERAQLAGPALEAVFFTFTATRTMQLHADGDRLSVEVTNDYNQPGRATDTIRTILVRD